MEPAGEYAASVFINCPFDGDYKPLFRAATFATIDCGFLARSALEIDDGGETRIEKIQRIIGQCKFGIHDISRTELDEDNELPRFNMPLELGIFLGAKKFGGKGQKDKRCLIMDREQYRYQIFISDIAGQDIKSHNDDPFTVISKVSEFLRNASERKTVPGGVVISNHYRAFREALPNIIAASPLEENEVGFKEFSTFSLEWLQEYAEL
jgi:hypothetical protein